MPQLVGAPQAMSLILTGSTVSALAAQKIGFVDAAVPKRQLKHAAVQFILNKPRPHKATLLQRLTNARLVRPLLSKLFYKQLKAKVRKDHYPAPYAVVENWVKDGAQGKRAQQHEAESIGRLLMNDTSKNLVRVFFLQEQMKGLAKGIKFTPKHLHVIGAGTMGGDIAAWCAMRGMSVTLQDREPKYIAPAIKRAHALFKKKLKVPHEIAAAMDRLMPDVNGTGVKRADVVIEAIYENLEAKRELYKKIQPDLKPDAILASNTSSIPLTELRTVLDDPTRLVGIHFFNPVPMMQLVEVVHAEDTDPEVVKKATAFVKYINRLPLPVKSSPGFLVNRVLMPYLMESFELLQDGVPGPIIDKEAVKFGMPMGPIELADIVGLDICLSVAENLAHATGSKVPEPLRNMVKAGELGRKTGKGFYHYQKGKPVKPKSSTDKKTSPDVIDRMILRMLNEAVACLREGVVSETSLLDAGLIFGTGFAPFRGGPMHYVDGIGKSVIRDKLVKLEKTYGKRFKPDAGWNSVVSSKKTTNKQTKPTDKG